MNQSEKFNNDLNDYIEYTKNSLVRYIPETEFEFQFYKPISSKKKFVTWSCHGYFTYQLQCFASYFYPDVLDKNPLFKEQYIESGALKIEIVKIRDVLNNPECHLNYGHRIAHFKNFSFDSKIERGIVI